MILIAPETEALARGLARKQGVSPEEAVKRAVERLAREAGIEAIETHKRQPAEMIAGIAAIAQRCASRPVYDARSADAIIGYDEHGVPT